MDPYVKSVDDEPNFSFWMHSSRSQIPSKTPSAQWRLGFDSLDDLATTQAKKFTTAMVRYFASAFS